MSQLNLPSTIAVDGPAASGKTTVGELLARRLGYLLFDTGVMYRAATLMALRSSIRIEDEAAVTELTESLVIDVRPSSADNGRLYSVLVNDEDVTYGLFSPEVDAHVSPVSAYPGVRAALIEQQRRIGERGGVVMVGRDIGTVVLPSADLKIYLDAAPEERARRRLTDRLARGEKASLVEVLSNVLERDEIDSEREHAPLCMAPDAIAIDSTALSVEEVYHQIQRLIEARYGKDPAAS